MSKGSMHKVDRDFSSVKDIEQFSDTKVDARKLTGKYKGVVAESYSSTEYGLTQFEGTVVYFPGVTLKQLKEA